MPPPNQRAVPPVKKSIGQIIDEQGLYPREAFDFLQRGLKFTSDQIHREQTDPEASRHISGQQLCEGLRQYALLQWGLLARVVLARWNIRRTEDFGKIVFTLVQHGELAKTDEDTLEDFRRVFNFADAFDAGYQIAGRAIESRT